LTRQMTGKIAAVAEDVCRVVHAVAAFVEA
jgi:hypothetical protein